ncbi:MAG TPA: carboxypeptidase-like regulatory domain-containing protein, partial [Candidatus Bathyarchaeia archaeon]|nr:carboxypeptidase-like regulatory domain-containing protein [Candidatus Bathyarchaeia archaeon]
MSAALLPSGYYWYQIGAKGDSSSQNIDGAKVTIKTVYDQVRNDAHSYWIGTLLSTGGFVQVGYLNGLSTSNQPYCCAWFFETFNTPSCDCPPVIGPEGSAGPIGSTHTYSMVHDSLGIWSFYMDGILLGKSPPSTDPSYLGDGATSSGGYSPAAIAEVAQTLDNKDIIGPAEFSDVEVRQNGVWSKMQAATVYCCTGFSSQTSLPITYGIQEVEGINNDFLAGTNILYHPKGATLWPTSLVLPNTVSFTFIDGSGNTFSPDWISLVDPGNGNVLYYTAYRSQLVPTSSTGTYTISYEYWHGVNVSKNTSVSDSASSQTVQGNVFSVPVRVVGRFYQLPVSGATLLTFLPDSTNQTVKTDSEGNSTLTQLPPGNYSLRISPPYGVTSVFRTSVAGPVNLSVSVFSIAELL